MDASACVDGLRLRRLWDAGLDGQRFDLVVAGQSSGGSDHTLGNEWRRWAERDFAILPANAGANDVLVEVAAQPVNTHDEFTAFTYQLLCRTQGDPIFSDGFELGDVSVWSDSQR
jgi:hypothetical protein